MWVTSLGYYRLPSDMVWVSPRQDEVRRGQVWTMGVEPSEQRHSVGVARCEGPRGAGRQECEAGRESEAGWQR